jgi:hypothetical protein
MLRFVVGALAANMMPVQCKSDVPISMACSGSQGYSLKLGIIGTASLGNLMGLQSGRRRLVALRIRQHSVVSATLSPSCRWLSERVILRAHGRWRFGLGTRRRSGRPFGQLEGQRVFSA